MNKRKVRLLRKAHRFLGVFLGIQFLFWTVSGLYFSWTDIDEIHGDHLKRMDYKAQKFSNLLGLDSLRVESGISHIELVAIGDKPFYWINNSRLFDATTGEQKQGISKAEAVAIAQSRMSAELRVDRVELITETGTHHEYRGRPLPAYAVSFQHPEEVVAYVSQADGKFQRVRHQSWRWFDFLWMTHTMDYEGRDDFNTLVLRTFSLLGLITVLSGFALWFATTRFSRK